MLTEMISITPKLVLACRNINKEHWRSKTLGGYGQGIEGPPNQWYHFVWGPLGSSEPLDIVHSVHALAYTLPRSKL